MFSVKSIGSIYLCTYGYVYCNVMQRGNQNREQEAKAAGHFEWQYIYSCSQVGSPHEVLAP